MGPFKTSNELEITGIKTFKLIKYFSSPLSSTLNNNK